MYKDFVKVIKNPARLRHRTHHMDLAWQQPRVRGLCVDVHPNVRSPCPRMWDVTLCGLLERTWREPRLMRSARLVGHTISGDSSAQQLPSRHCRGDTVQTRTGWRVSSDCGADVDWDMWSWRCEVRLWPVGGRRRLNIVGLGLHPQPSAYGDACSLQCECWQLHNLAGLQPSINLSELEFSVVQINIYSLRTPDVLTIDQYLCGWGRLLSCFENYLSVTWNHCLILSFIQLKS